MFVVAIVGLIINLLSMRVLATGKERSLNVKGAYLEVWADMLGSVGVIVGAVVIMTVRRSDFAFVQTVRIDHGMSSTRPTT